MRWSTPHRARRRFRPLLLENLESRVVPSFVAPLAFDTGASPFAVVLADLNGDGFPDLATANLEGRSVSVLLGTGDGSFQATRHFPAGESPWALAVGEFNGDGHPDLAVAHGQSSRVSVLLGTGDGSFQAARHFDVERMPRSVAVGDLNGDGRQDLATANRALFGGTPSVSVLLGTGDGSFQPQSLLVGGQPRSVAAGEFNGDGRPDLAVASTSGVRVHLGNGDGSFQAAQIFGSGNHLFVAVGEFNGDGVQDLATGSWVVLGNGDGTFRAAVSHGGDGGYLAVGEFNGDGVQDLALTSQHSFFVDVRLSNGDGTFRPSGSYPAGIRGVAAGLVNGDSHLDLVVANRSSATVSVLLGNGDGTFEAARAFPAGQGPISVAVGEFNGDGRADLVVGNLDSDSVRVLLGNGDGTFQGTLDYAAGALPWEVVVGDLDGDGRQDLAVVAYQGVRVLRGNGDGTFQGTSGSYLGGYNPTGVALADFDGDGWSDLAAANTGSNDVAVLRNDGYWGGPVAYYYVYPDGGAVTAGVPIDVYVFVLDAQFNVVANYREAIAFWTTDPQATTPIYYEFQASDRGVAYFPGGLTFRTPGIQELYVFDWPGVRAWGYAAFEVGGAAPGAGGGSAPALDLFAANVLTPERVPAGRPLAAAVPSRGEGRPAEAVAAAAAPLRAPAFVSSAAPRPVLDRLFAAPWGWDAVPDALAAAVQPYQPEAPE